MFHDWYVNERQWIPTKIKWVRNVNAAPYMPQMPARNRYHCWRALLIFELIHSSVLQISRKILLKYFSQSLTFDTFKRETNGLRVNILLTSHARKKNQRLFRFHFSSKFNFCFPVPKLIPFLKQNDYFQINKFGKELILWILQNFLFFIFCSIKFWVFGFGFSFILWVIFQTD